MTLDQLASYNHKLSVGSIQKHPANSISALISFGTEHLIAVGTACAEDSACNCMLIYGQLHTGVDGRAKTYPRGALLAIPRHFAFPAIYQFVDSVSCGSAIFLQVTGLQ